MSYERTLMYRNKLSLIVGLEDGLDTRFSPHHTPVIQAIIGRITLLFARGRAICVINVQLPAHEHERVRLVFFEDVFRIGQSAVRDMTVPTAGAGGVDTYRDAM